MISKLTFVLLILVSYASATFKEINYTELQKMQKQGIVVIDIRRLDEFKQYGIIKDAHTLTFFDERGNHNIPAWMNKFVQIVKSKNQAFIIYCAHANRTKILGNFLSKQLGYKYVYDLQGGINYGWLDKGKETVRYK